MRRFLSQTMSVLAALAICWSSGAHWMLLQSVAWAGMVVTYAQDRTLAEAVSDTFDGQHPCDMCKVIANGQKQEGKSQPRSATSAPGKVWLYFVAESLDFSPFWERADFLGVALNGEMRRDPPPSPPPRWA